MDDDVFGENLPELINNVFQKAVEHRVALLEELGVNVSPETQEAMKTQGLKNLQV